MKNMKRVICWIITVMLIINMLPLAALAADNAGQVENDQAATTPTTQPITFEVGEASKPIGSADNIVKVSVSIKNNPGFIGAQLTINYADGLTLLNNDPQNGINDKFVLNKGLGGLLNNQVPNQGSVILDSTANIGDDDVLFTLTFQINDTTKPGNYAIGITVDYLAKAVYDKDGNIGFVELTNQVNDDDTGSVTVGAVQVGNNFYASIKDALAAAEAGKAITLLADVTEEKVEINNKNITLDLNGETLNGSIIAPNAELIIMNGNIVNNDKSVSAIEINAGTLLLKGVNVDSERHAIRIDGGVIATIAGGTYKVTGTNKGTYHVLNVSGNAKVTIENGTFIGPKGTSADSGAAVNVQSGASVEILYGNFSGGKRNTLASAGTLTVKGGIFDQNPSAYVANGYCVASTADGFKVATHNPVKGEVVAPTLDAQGYTVYTCAHCGVSENKDYVDALVAVATVNGNKYTTLAAALKAANAGDTITFLQDITEDVTITKAVTIDGAGKTYTGAMTLKADTTIKNVNFDGKGYNGYAITTRGATYLTIEDCTAANYGYGFVQLASGTALTTVKNVTASNMNYGVKVDYSNAVVLENVDITASVAAIYNSNYGGKTITIKDSELNIIKTWKRNDTIKTTYVFEGDNTVGEFKTYEAIDNFKLADKNSTLTAPAGITVTTDVAGYSVKYENGKYFVKADMVKIGEKTYASLAEALAAAKNGDEITFLADINENVTIEKAVTINGAGKTYTGAMTLKADTIIKNVNFDGKGYNGYAIETRGADYLTIVDCTAVNYGYGFVQLASGTVLTTVKNVTVSNMNYGVKVDYSNAVVLENVDFDCAVAAVLNSNYGEKTITIKNSDISILGTWVRNNTTKTTYVFEGNNTVGKFIIDAAIDNFKLAAGATLTAPEGYNVTTDVVNSVVKYENGTYKVVGVVAKIGNTYYETLAEAFTAAQDGNEVEILVAGTYKVPTGKNITITGAVDGVKFDMAKAVGINASMTFKNVTFEYSSNENYIGLQHAGTMKYNNCTFNGQVFLYGTSETFNNCTFNQDSANAYNVWTYGANVVKFDGCTFNSAGKSVLIYAESTSIYNKVAVTDCTFKASAAVDGKAAIEMDSSLTSGIELTITNSTVDGFGTGNVSKNSLWNNKKWDSTDKNNDITVVVDNVTVLAPINFVAKIGETGYTTIDAAIKAAQADETVTILAGNYATNISVNKAITVVGETDANGNNLVNISGKLNVTANGATVKNLNVKNSGTACYIGAKDVLVEGCTLEGSNGLYQSYTSGKVTFKNSTIIGATYGIHFDGNAGGEIVIENCKITGWTSFAKKIKNVTITGTTFNVGNYNYIRFYQENVVINGCTFNEKMAIDLAVNGAEVTVTNSTLVNGNVEDLFAGADIVNSTITVDGTKLVRVAKIGNVYYETLAGALAAAQDGETIELLWTEGSAPIAMNGAVYGKSVTITGTATVDWSKGWLFIGRGGAGNGTVIFDNANLTSASNSSSYGFHVSGREKNTTDKYDGTLVINNSTIELDFLINKGTMTLNNSTLTVKNGFSVGGRPASETENNKDATATLNITNGSKVVVNNHNGMGLGYEAIGVMNIDATSAFETTQSFLVTATGTMNLAGTATVAGTLTNNGSIVLTAVGATLTSSECGNVTTNVADYKVAYANNAYKLTAKAYVAQIGTNKFETVADALAYAKNEGMNEVVITLLGANSKAEAIALKDSFYLYDQTAFYKVTFKQADPSKVYYISGIYTGSRTNGGQFVFDGVNIVVTGQYIFEGNVVLTNNSVIKSVAESNCFIYNGVTIIEPGSKLQGVIEDFRGGDMIIDGGKTDGSYNTDPNFQDAIIIINWSGDKLVLKNGAYAKINAANEVGRMTINAGAAVEMYASKLETVEYITVNGTLQLDLKSLVSTKKITGNGKIVVDATGFDGDTIQLITADMSGFTGTIKVINAPAVAEITSAGLVINKAAAAIGTTGYATLQAAIDAAKNGDVITLLADVTAAEVIEIGESITINGNGYTVTSSARRIINVIEMSNCEVTIKDLKLVSTAERVGTNDIRGINVYECDNVTLNIDNCSVDFRDASATDWSYAINVCSDVNNSTLSVNGGTYEGANVINVHGANNTVIVKNATLTSLYPNNDQYYGACIWVLQNQGSSVEATGNTFYGANAIAFNLGTGTALTESNNIDNTTRVVAKIGGTYYTSLADAIAAVGAGDVVIELVADATLDYNARDAYGTAETTSLTINGNGKTLTLNQKDSDWASIGLANADAKLVLNNMTIEKTGHGDTSGAWNTHAIIFSCNVEMNKVTVNNAIAVQNGATLKDVIINEANGYYGLWINGNGQTVTMNGGAINATNGGRGIKIADQYIDAPAIVNLTVDGTVFNTAKKAAVLVSSEAGAKITASNVDITNVEEDTVNFVWVDEDWAANYGKVTVNDAPAAQENLAAFNAAIVNGDKVVGYYKTLDKAIAAAKAGDTIVLFTTYVVKAGETKVLNLPKDVTVSMVTDDDKMTSLIYNNGNLTITGEGKLSYKYTGNDQTDAHNTIESAPGSVLTIKGGIIENLSENCLIAYAVDGLTNGGAGDVVINIEGGKLSSKKIAVRIFANSTTNTGTLNISGGEIYGRVIIQSSNANANKAVLNITGGTFNTNGYKTDVLYVGGTGSTSAIVASVSGGIFNGEILSSIKNGFISGGTFTQDVAKYCAYGFRAENVAENTWTVVPVALGDVNGDGSVNVADVMLLRQYIVGLKRDEDIIVSVADFNEDGGINVLDVVLIRQGIANQTVNN